MKSLDFIIKQIGILQDGITTEEFKIEQKSGSEATIVFLQELIKEYEQVKQDLEVLEIINKCRFIGYPGFCRNTIVIDNITNEQYLKIKDWKKDWVEENKE